MRAGNGKYSGSAGPGKKDGKRLGEFRSHRQSQPARIGVVAGGPRPRPDHGLGQSLPHGGRPGRRRAQDIIKLTTPRALAAWRIRSWMLYRKRKGTNETYRTIQRTGLHAVLRTSRSVGKHSGIACRYG